MYMYICYNSLHQYRSNDGFPCVLLLHAWEKLGVSKLNLPLSQNQQPLKILLWRLYWKKNDTDVFDFDLEKKAHMTWTTAPNIIEIYFMTIFFIQTLVKGSFSRRFFSDFFMCSQRLNSYSLSKTFFTNEQNWIKPAPCMHVHQNKKDLTKIDELLNK